ncbi:MAG: hypothetical protein EPN14_06240 [Gallionella sp.]|nr:MAG: hypothetical protein EPN14_06240 [Gallionella sp.]
MKTILALLALALSTVAGIAVAAPQQNAPAAQAAAIPLPNKGKVLEVIDTSMYTYLQVSTDKSPVWIAASKIKLAKGDTVSYSNGAVMSNFHSKSLNRTFESIIFVDKVVPVKK